MPLYAHSAWGHTQVMVERLATLEIYRGLLRS
jgi:hypothetical protein